MTRTMTETEMRAYNLRHELAKQLWNARSGNINVAEALENTRDLVVLMPEDMIGIADRLQHKVLNQITKKYGKICLMRKGLECSDLRVTRVPSRMFLGAVRLPQDMIG